MVIIRPARTVLAQRSNCHSPRNRLQNEVGSYMAAEGSTFPVLPVVLS